MKGESCRATNNTPLAALLLLAVLAYCLRRRALPAVRC
ncbi:MYXO-CTERM sorting domain-containing protein [Herbaspirillum sp. meg3]